MAEEAGTTTTDTTVAADATAASAAADAGKSVTVSPDASAAADAPKEGDAPKAEAPKAAEPVDYAKALAEVKLPEGMKLDPAQSKLGTDLFAKHSLTADAVKDLVSLYAQQQKAGADGNAKAFADQVGVWKADAEKSTTAEERGTAKDAALKIFGADEMKLLETFGVTNRSGFIKALAKVGKAIKDDPFVPGDAGAVNGSKDPRRAFPNSNMNP